MMQPYPYTEETARGWFDIVSKEENMARSGKWTPDGGSEGPLVLTNYALTVKDEAVGSIGLDFGKGASHSKPLRCTAPS